MIDEGCVVPLFIFQDATQQPPQVVRFGFGPREIMYR